MEGLDGSLIGGLGVAVGAILTVVFGFLLRWRKANLEEQAALGEDPAPQPARLGSGSYPRPALPADEPKDDFDELVAYVRDQRDAAREKTRPASQEEVADVALSIKAVSADVTSLKADTSEVRMDMAEVKSNLKAVATKLDDHIKRTGPHAPAAGRTRAAG